MNANRMAKGTRKCCRWLAGAVVWMAAVAGVAQAQYGRVTPQDSSDIVLISPVGGVDDDGPTCWIRLVRVGAGCGDLRAWSEFAVLNGFFHDLPVLIEVSNWDEYQPLSRSRLSELRSSFSSDVDPPLVGYFGW